MDTFKSVLETGKLVYDIFGNQIGYIINPEKKMEQLDKNAQHLFARMDDLEKIAKELPNVATSESKLWLEDVKKLEVEVQSIKDEHMRCSNVFSRPELGKRVGDVIEEITDLNNKRPKLKGNEFSNAPLEKVEPQIVGMNSLTDSEPRLQKILGLIADVKVGKIGIWGMGGIGKTRTLKLLNNRLEESHMFDIVIWVTVSGEGSRRKVQNDIAERLKCNEKDMSDDRLRANISKNLSGKKFLLILDDIWEKIDLCDVGIPILNQDNGCKVLLTTRDLGVCRQMETDVEIQMEKLSEVEAWSLFNEKAGDVAMSPSIEPIARDIVKKCSGLPLAIIVIGSSLRKINYVGVWRNMLRKLQLPSTSQIKSMEKEVFSCLKISYDRLPNDFERNLFLYCSLYPEDYEISITELVEYCWLEGYIQGVDSIEEARDDGHHMEEEEEMSVASHTHNVISYNNDRLILPNIQVIEFYNLPELVSIWRGFSNFEWPSLETISILGKCPKLKSLSFLSNGTNIVAPALKKIYCCESEWWEALEWEDNDIKQRLQPFYCKIELAK